MKTGSFLCECWTLTRCAGHTLQSYYEGWTLGMLDTPFDAGLLMVAGLHFGRAGPSVLYTLYESWTFYSTGHLKGVHSFEGHLVRPKH